MKLTISTTSLLLLLIVANAQDKFKTFNEQKKSIDLRTGICVSYIDTGAVNGTPLLLLHGYTDTSRSFQLVIEDLLKRNDNVRIIAPDLRGHGGSSMPNENACKNAPENCFSPQQFANDILALLDELCIEKVHIVGHSMGSVIAQELALQNKERVNSLVLIGTFVNGRECVTIHDFLMGEMIETDWKCIIEEGKNAAWPADAYSFLPLNLGERVTNFLKENWVIEEGATSDFLNAILPETLRVPLGTWIGSIRALDKVDNSAELRKLTVPTLILWGMHDNLTDPSDQVRVKMAFRNAARQSGTKVIYKIYGRQSGGSGHNLHWAAHQTVSQDIMAFIEHERANNYLQSSNTVGKSDFVRNTGVEGFELK